MWRLFPRCHGLADDGLYLRIWHGLNSLEMLYSNPDGNHASRRFLQADASRCQRRANEFGLQNVIDLGNNAGRRRRGGRGGRFFRCRRCG